MNVASTARCFCLVVFIGYGYIFHLTDSLSVNGVYTDNNAEFTCVISPYTGSQRWYIDSVIVAFCGAIVCSTEPTNPGRYNFTPNVGTGTFIFKIDPTERTDHNKIVGCYDGTDTKTLTINLPDKDQNNSSFTNTTSTTVDSSTVTDEPGLGAWCIVGICFGTIGFLAVVICAIVFVCVRPVITMAKMGDTEIQLEWTDCIDCFRKRFFKYNIVYERIAGVPYSPKELSTGDKKCKLQNLEPNALYEISLSRILCCCKSLETKRYVTSKISVRVILGGNVGNQLPKPRVNCTINWTVEGLDHLIEPTISLSSLCYDVIYRGGQQEVHIKKIQDSSCTITNLSPVCLYDIEVWAIYRSVKLEPHGKISFQRQSAALPNSDN